MQFEEKGLPEHLQDAGVSLGDIEAVVWSHSHFDHIGDMTIFPGSVDLVVGPGFTEARIPAYPTNQESMVPESAWEGRKLHEVEEKEFTESGLKVGELPAVDYFGDGSFYLVYTPGHMVEHMCALVRTTKGEGEDDTFLFLGGDICHHGSELRPSRFLPLPGKYDFKSASLGSVCPGDLFESLQKSRGKSIDEPVFEPALSEDKALAVESIYKAQEADGKNNVLFLFAHDAAPLETVDFTPKYANEWKSQGWREKMLWSFLEDLGPALES